MKWPQFTIRELLRSTTLIALAIGAYQLAIQMAFSTSQSQQAGFAHLMIAVWLGSGALLGTAIFIPFRQPLNGAIFGLILALILLLLPSVLISYRDGSSSRPRIWTAHPRPLQWPYEREHHHIYVARGRSRLAISGWRGCGNATC